MALEASPWLLLTPGYRACSIVRWESYFMALSKGCSPVPGSPLGTYTGSPLGTYPRESTSHGTSQRPMTSRVGVGIVLVTMIKTSSVYFSTSFWQISASFWQISRSFWQISASFWQISRSSWQISHSFWQMSASCKWNRTDGCTCWDAGTPSYPFYALDMKVTPSMPLTWRLSLSMVSEFYHVGLMTPCFDKDLVPFDKYLVPFDKYLHPLHKDMQIKLTDLQWRGIERDNINEKDDDAGLGGWSASSNGFPCTSSQVTYFCQST